MRKPWQTFLHGSITTATWWPRSRWENLGTPVADMRGVVYYSVVETCTHWFISAPSSVPPQGLVRSRLVKWSG